MPATNGGENGEQFNPSLLSLELCRWDAAGKEREGLRKHFRADLALEIPLGVWTSERKSRLRCKISVVLCIVAAISRPLRCQFCVRCYRIRWIKSTSQMMPPWNCLPREMKNDGPKLLPTWLVERMAAAASKEKSHGRVIQSGPYPRPRILKETYLCETA